MYSNNTGNNHFTDKILESYSIVLSVTILVIAVIFGTGGNFIVFFSLHHGNLLKRRQYFIMALLLLTGLIADIIWCPVEIVNLLKYQHGDEHLNGNLKAVSPSIYICLLMLFTFAIALMSLECIWKLTKCCTLHTWSIASVAGLILAIIITLCVTIIYSITTANNEVIYNLLYTTVNKQSFYIRLTTLSVCIVILLLIILLLFAVGQKCDQSESESESSSSEKQGMFNVPALMIGGDDGESGEPCIDDTTPKLLPSPNQLLVQDSNFSDEEDCTVGELKPLGKSKNILGVDMNKILGRRRHTICQIGETETPQEKAKKYNYVRKFSVDITALQAQLENPKIFGEKPFTSESDLLKQKKDKETENKTEEKPLSLVLNTKLAPLGISNVGNRVAGIKESVGEEDEEEKAEEDIQSTKSELECPSEPAMESHQTEDLECCSVDSSKRLIKFVCLFSVTFVCCILPMLITESLQGRLSRNAYVNIITCTIALSVIQTIIYPHILFYMDGKIHKSVRELIQKLRQRILCQKDINDNSNMKNIQIDVTQL